MQDAEALGLLLDAMTLGPSAAIEHQEKRGQAEQVRSQRLPRDFNGQTKEQFEKAGFVFGESIDDLFVAVTFPAGWEAEGSDHSMWSYIVDDKGRRRVSVFYKAAFYDRKAHANLSCRYGTTYGAERADDQTEIVVTDHEAPLDSAPRFVGRSYSETCPHEQARTWLNENFPDWRDANAYWDTTPTGATA